MHEGDRLGPARADRLAGRRRGGDHRPRRAARRARRRPAARLPRVHGRLGGDPALGQGPRRAGDRRGHPAPPAAHRRPAPRATTRCSRSTRRCAPTPTSQALRAGLADGTIDAVATDHAPHAVEDKESEWAAARPGHARAGAGAVRRRRDDGRDRAARLAGVADRMSVRPGRDRPAGRARPAARRRASRPTCCCSTRPPAAVVDPAALASRSRNTPYAGRELPGRVVATFLRGEPTVLDGKAGSE